jgi:hypothetical protein
MLLAIQTQNKPDSLFKIRRYQYEIGFDSDNIPAQTGSALQTPFVQETQRAPDVLT